MYNFKILSLNIWNTNYHWERRFKLIEKLIHQEQPDLIGLQEAVESQDESQDQIGKIKKILPEHAVVWYKGHEHKDGSFGGPVVLSKLPIIKSSFQKLTLDQNDPDDNYQRMVIASLIEIPQIDQKLIFVNTHLSFSQAACKRTVVEVVDFINKFNQEKSPIIFACDLNFGPESAVARFLNGRQTIDNKTAEFVDAWKKSHPNAEQTTWPITEKLIMEAHKLKNKPLNFEIKPRRMDYIFLSHELADQLQECRLVGDQPDNKGLYPSDHLGVLVTIQLK